MKNYIKNGILSLTSLLILTAICHYIYEWNHLYKVFGSRITFEQWMAIIVIIHTLVPTKKLFSIDKKDKDDE